MVGAGKVVLDSPNDSIGEDLGTSAAGPRDTRGQVEVDLFDNVPKHTTFTEVLRMTVSLRQSVGRPGLVLLCYLGVARRGLDAGMRERGRKGDGKGDVGSKALLVFPVFWQRGGHRQPIDRGGPYPEESRHRPARRCLGIWGGRYISAEIVKLF